MMRLQSVGLSLLVRRLAVQAERMSKRGSDFLNTPAATRLKVATSAAAPLEDEKVKAAIKT